MVVEVATYVLPTVFLTEKEWKGKKGLNLNLLSNAAILEIRCIKYIADFSNFDFTKDIDYHLERSLCGCSHSSIYIYMVVPWLPYSKQTPPTTHWVLDMCYMYMLLSLALWTMRFRWSQALEIYNEPARACTQPYLLCAPQLHITPNRALH